MTESEPWSYFPDGSPVYSLADIIRKRAAATPAAIALAEAGRLTSFAELDRRSSQVARALQAGGVRPGGWLRTGDGASLARTASGKLQKQAIRATLTTPAVP